MKVNAIHPLYDAFKPRWELCADTVAGPHVMSAKADKYLMSLCDGIDSNGAAVTPTETHAALIPMVKYNG